MKKYSLCIAVIFFLIIKISSAQIVEVKLEKTGENSKEIMVSRVQKDTSVCKNFPFKNYTSYSLRRFPYNPLQSVYERMSKEAYQNFVKLNNSDTTYVFKGNLLGNVIYVAVGIDSLGRKHVVVDANNDKDFRGDKEYIVNLSSKKSDMIELDLRIEYFNGIKVLEKYIPVLLDPYNTFLADASYESEQEKKLDLTIYKINPNLKGSLKVNGNDYFLKVLNYNHLFERNPFFIEVEKLPLNKKNGYSKYTSLEKLDIGYHQYEVLSLKRDTLILKFIKENIDAGAEVGTPALEVNELDIITGKSVKLKSKKGKYSLIDFWGTWCKPCIALLPELEHLYEKYKDNVEFISVAYDKKADEEKLKKIVKDNNMVWAQLLDEIGANREGIIAKYRIREFPTSILVDDKGIVVFRASGEKGLKELIAYLDKQISLKK